MIELLNRKYMEADNIAEKLELSLTIAMLRSSSIIEERKLFRNMDGYKWTIRTREDSRHIPHFHIEKSGRQGSFELMTGEVIKDECCNLNSKEIKVVQIWYKEYRDGLINLWNEIHTERKVVENV